MLGLLYFFLLRINLKGKSIGKNIDLDSCRYWTEFLLIAWMKEGEICAKWQVARLNCHWLNKWRTGMTQVGDILYRVKAEP